MFISRKGTPKDPDKRNRHQRRTKIAQTRKTQPQAPTRTKVKGVAKLPRQRTKASMPERTIKAQDARKLQGSPKKAARKPKRADGFQKPGKLKHAAKPRHAARRQKPPKVIATVKDYSILKVDFLRNQNDRQFVAVTRGGVTAIGSVDHLLSERPMFFADLARQGVRILQPAMQRDLVNQIDENRVWKGQLYFAQRSGFHLGGYVMPNERVIGKIASPNVRVDLGEQRVVLAEAGSADRQMAYIKRFVSGQDLLIAALGVGLVGPVLELLGLPNIGVDESGESSTGKSTALDLTACAWGAPLKMPGSIAFSARGTVNGFEQRMGARNGAVVLIDETNLLGDFGSRRAGVSQADLVFMLSEGCEKLRFGDSNAERATFGFLLTSNRSLRSQLSGADRASLDAVGVRLITLPADGGAGLGVLSRLVPGFASAGEAIDALKAEMVQHHGHLAARFLKAMLRARRTDEAALIRQGHRRIQAFVDQTHADRNVGLDLRTARALGAINLALRWAVEWNVLPLKGAGAAMLRCYQRATASAGRDAEAHSAIGRVRAYIAANRTALGSHERTKGIAMTKKALAVHAGFKAKRREQKLLLISLNRWNATFGNDARGMLEELKRQTRLQITGEKGFQLQIRVRADKNKDRMIAIVVD